MAKNLEIANALNSPELLTKAGPVEALSALVLAGNDLSNFRNALEAHKDFWKQFAGLNNAGFEDDDIFLTVGGNGDGDKLETLFKLAAEKRVILGVQSANEDILKKIIAPNNEQAVRTALATDPVATQIGKVHEAPGWDVADEAVLTDDVTDLIQMTVQNLLLASKIKVANAANIAKVDDLLKAIAEGNNANFVLAAKALGVDDVSAAKMAHDGVGPLVRAEAAKKSFMVNFDKIYTDNYAFDGAGGKKNPYTELNKPDDQFIAALPAPYTHISVADAASIKGVLGSRYLSTKIDRLDHPTALKIAKLTNPVQLRAALKGNQADVFLAEAVNEQSIPGFRHLAAVRALKFEVEKSYDLPALKALSAARNATAFNTMLETSPSLGFDGESGKELRNAFKKDTSALAALIPAAHVRLSMIEAIEASNQEDLKSIFTATALNNDDFSTKFLEKFPSNVNPEIFKPYFANNRLMVQQQALLAATKLKFAELDADELGDILAAVNDGGLRDIMKNTLGVADNSIDALIQDSNVEQINKELRAYAQTEYLLKFAATKDYDDLLEIINELQEDVLLKGVIDVPGIMVTQTALMNTLLAKCPADKIDDLVKLTQAKNLVDMKKALEDLGVEGLQWVAEDNMQALREVALPRALELKIDAVSRVAQGSRPELLKLFKGFSPEKQQALLADDKLIPAVMNATSVAKFAKMLNIADSLVAADTDLGKECERIILSGKIQNADIAKIVAGMSYVTMTGDKVDQINALLIERHLDLKEANYVQVLGRIRDIVAPSDVVKFNTTFGMAADGLRYTGNAAIRTGILNQYQYNNDTAAQLRFNLPASENGVYQFIASLHKGEALTTANGTKIVDAFKDATSQKDLIVKIKAINPALHVETIQSFEQAMSSEKYRQLKSAFSHTKFLDNTSRQTAIDESDRAADAELAELKKLTDVNKAMNSELKRLSNLSAMAWLNPAFQSAAHKNAHAMKQQFTELNDVCNIIVTRLENAQVLFQEKLDSLPSQADVRASGLTAKEQQSIEDHRDFLTKQREGIAKDLGIYTKVQTVLQGNPNNPSDSLTGKGVLTMLDEAMAGRPVKFLGYESKCVAYKKSEREAHFKQGYTGVKADPMPLNMVLGANTKSYEVDPDNTKLGQDEFFEHTIGSGNDEGYFTEEHGPRHQMPHYKTGKGTASVDEVDFPVEVKLSPNKFPTTETGKIQYSMAMASRMLAGATPSLENKILLQGADGDKIRHMWTACMAQMMAMGISAKDAQKFITVRCPFFDPAQEMGMLYGLSGESLYETKYKNSPIVTGQNADIQELTKDLAEAEKDKKDVVKDMKVVNEKFKEAKTVMQEMKDKNEATDNETPSIRIR